MTWEDPIVKEVRDIRDKIAAEHRYDVRAIGRYYQQKQARAARKLVTRPPRRPDIQRTATR
ncbi:MAG: hypothetical protein AAB294_05950 [Pseudomonadota bacterium]